MNLLVDAAEISLIVIAVVVVTDFLSGVVHWLEDSYGHEDLPIIGPMVVQANVRHHFDPRHMVHHSWLSSALGPLLVAGLALVIAFFAGVLTWPVVLLALITANANEIHKWAHRSKAENGRVIAFFQGLGLLQSRAHHAKHHQLLKDTNYCVVTNYLNPALEKLSFWRRLEASIFRVSGAWRREDPSTTAERYSYPVPTCSDAACRKRREAAALVESSAAA